MADYYTEPFVRVRVVDAQAFNNVEVRMQFIPLVRTGQGDYRRDYTPKLKFRPRWYARQAWWRTLKLFRTRTA